MGIESDQVVYEYLSRVGDVAQQRQLSSATRMRLVSELRNEIERRRAKSPVDSPAAVRRIIDRLGSPDDLVSAAAEGGGTPSTPTPSVPVQRDRDAQPEQPGRQKQPKQGKQPETTGRPEEPKRTRRPEQRESQEPQERPERPKGIRRLVPRPRTGAPPPSGVPSDAASPPHRAPAHELGDGGGAPDWWLNEPTPFGPGEDIPGFVGGVEIPDLLKPPPSRKPEGGAVDADDASDAVEGSAAPDDGAPAAPARRRRLRLSRAAGAPARRWTNPLLLIAAGCLVAGAALGNWFVLILGWLIAYASRRLSERETKAAVFWLPGLALTAGLVWLWGRSEGRWGAPVAEGHMSDAIADTWPWVIRGAAVASALFLAWRSQRQR
ncbi:hypothetical protein [Streptomyces sp. FL07-04A]|uniref:hypothetical protein n=1 Tax=Streptomyces sp. FL07-04A TaxID=3028658 RepID=UPI0029AF5F24|nr:hypothetical protein [Streptomyces sp. FL07-04A]MDX3575751.1 hypothetical protein [Streptomyces sp. FL07-04A]